MDACSYFDGEVKYLELASLKICFTLEGVRDDSLLCD